MGMMEKILNLMAEKKASDVFMSANAPVLIKINGVSTPINSQTLPVEGTLTLLAEVVTPEQIEELKSTGELNLAISLPGVGRFRLSAMRQRGSYAAVLRYISTEVPPLESLNVPMTLADMVMAKRGLMLMVGATGSGKSTTIAAMLEHRNSNAGGHILTLEDPIEYLFKSKKSIINQREIGSDTATMQSALKNALRQAPDVIFIGEIRDRESMSHALGYAQSGHLVIATMHANNSYQALNRILSFYPVEVRATLLNDLSSALRCILSQRLLRTVNGGRTPAVEVMVNSRLISELIEKGDFFGVREALEKSMAEESQTFEQDIARLIVEGTVERKEGLAYADSPTNLLWRLENTFTSAKKEEAKAQEPKDEGPTFSDFTLDVNH